MAIAAFPNNPAKFVDLPHHQKLNYRAVELIDYPVINHGFPQGYQSIAPTLPHARLWQSLEAKKLLMFTSRAELSKIKFRV